MVKRFSKHRWWGWTFRPTGKVLAFVFRNIEIILILLLIAIAAIQYYVRPQSQSFLEMRDTRSIRVLISDEPDSQYIFNKQHYGFEYELLARFADQYGLRLQLEVVPFAELFSLLESGAGDIAVGGIFANSYVERISQPTIPWYQAETTVVYKRGTEKPKNVAVMGERGVLASARYYGIPGFEELQLRDDHRSEYKILNAVAVGAERYALTTKYRAHTAKHYLPELNSSFTLPQKVDLVWALPKQHDEQLLGILNDFLQIAMDQGLPKKLARQHFAMPTQLSKYDALSLQRKIDSVLPDYELAFRKAARKGNIDWFMLAAISYQESHWSNNARSPTGVRGIMQMTEDTADYLDISDRMDTSQTIVGAARYIRKLRARFPKEIKDPERTWFAVGAYNMGYKHIKNAYLKACEEGLDCGSWEVISEQLPGLYGAPFAPGVEAKNYVSRVQIYTDILRFYDIHQRDKNQILPDKVVAAN